MLRNVNNNTISKRNEIPIYTRLLINNNNNKFKKQIKRNTSGEYQRFSKNKNKYLQYPNVSKHTIKLINILIVRR